MGELAWAAQHDRDRRYSSGRRSTQTRGARLGGAAQRRGTRGARLGGAARKHDSRAGARATSRWDHSGRLQGQLSDCSGCALRLVAAFRLASESATAATGRTYVSDAAARASLRRSLLSVMARIPRSVAGCSRRRRSCSPGNSSLTSRHYSSLTSTRGARTRRAGREPGAAAVLAHAARSASRAPWRGSAPAPRYALPRLLPRQSTLTPLRPLP